MGFKVAAGDFKKRVRVRGHLLPNGTVREGWKGVIIKDMDVEGHKGQLSPLGLQLYETAYKFLRINR